MMAGDVGMTVGFVKVSIKGDDDSSGCVVLLSPRAVDCGLCSGGCDWVVKYADLVYLYGYVATDIDRRSGA